jgi:type II secretory pathway pseudopilin PulG
MTAELLAAWVSVLVQAGALGLLAVLLTVVLPREAAAARQERADAAREFARLAGQLQDRFDARAQELVSAINKQTTDLLISGGSHRGS